MRRLLAHMRARLELWLDTELHAGHRQAAANVERSWAATTRGADDQ